MVAAASSRREWAFSERQTSVADAARRLEATATGRCGYHTASGPSRPCLDGRCKARWKEAVRPGRQQLLRNESGDESVPLHQSGVQPSLQQGRVDGRLSEMSQVRRGDSGSRQRVRSDRTTDGPACACRAEARRSTGEADGFCSTGRPAGPAGSPAGSLPSAAAAETSPVCGGRACSPAGSRRDAA